MNWWSTSGGVWPVDFCLDLEPNDMNICTDNEFEVGVKL